jgi:hypothetical protein
VTEERWGPGVQIGHDGFDAPGGGSYYHQLHHAHYECNYGATRARAREDDRSAAS